MARVACLMMQKDEGELLRTWIEYHRQLFGLHNLFIFDNSSSDQITLNILNKFRRSGMSVNEMFPHPEAHTERGRIFGDLIKQLDTYQGFDFYLPIDCDEFVVFKDSENSITADPKVIHQEFDKLLEQEQALGMDGTYYNILGRPDHFFDWPQRKTFFRRDTFQSMDNGFHEGISRLAPGKHETNFRYMHYHHKPFDLLVEHSKNKLRAFFDPDDEEQLKAPENRNRLTSFILDGEEAYMNKFKTDAGLYLPAFGQRLNQIGITMPF